MRRLVLDFWRFPFVGKSLGSGSNTEIRGCVRRLCVWDVVTVCSYVI